MAEFFGLDATLVRVLWFISILFGGVGIVIYIGLALIVPLEPESPDTHTGGPSAGAAFHRHMSANSGRLSLLIGSVLILFGSLALLQVVLPDWVSWRQVWPVMVIGIGAVLIAVALRRRVAIG